MVDVGSLRKAESSRPYFRRGWVGTHCSLAVCR